MDPPSMRDNSLTLFIDNNENLLKISPSTNKNLKLKYPTLINISPKI